METEVANDTPCSSIAVESTLRVGTAGALWGLCRGPYDATKSGLTSFSRASFVAKLMGKTGAQCEPAVGHISSMKNVQVEISCRKKINSAAAGAMAGVVIAAGTRSRKQVAAMAALLSIVCAAADYSRTF